MSLQHQEENQREKGNLQEVIHKSFKMRTNQSKIFLAFVVLSSLAMIAHGRVAFEKLTDYDFSGTTYYSVKNLSLYECQGWCREEQDCQAAAFSFVVNPLTPAQETLCQLQNDSSAHNPSAVAQRSASMYYMVKLQLRSENVCLRPWAFERVPNKIIRGLDNALIYTSTKEACLSACLNEVSSAFRFFSMLLGFCRHCAPLAGAGTTETPVTDLILEFLVL